MVVVYAVERLSWLFLELARKVRDLRGRPQDKQVNAPQWRWQL